MADTWRAKLALRRLRDSSSSALLRRLVGHGQWDCRELADQLLRDGLVAAISADTVRRILQNHQLKPWRQHMWLSPQVPRDADFAARVQNVADLYTRPLATHEMVLCVDEKTSLQPRPRKTPTKPACPGRPVQVEHEYGRCGALNLFAAFDTRTGHVYGMTRSHPVLGGSDGITKPTQTPDGFTPFMSQRIIDQQSDPAEQLEPGQHQDSQAIGQC